MGKFLHYLAIFVKTFCMCCLPACLHSWYWINDERVAVGLRIDVLCLLVCVIPFLAFGAIVDVHPALDIRHLLWQIKISAELHN